MESANPYQTPVGDLATDDEGVGEVRFFSPDCRIGRIRYLSHTFIFTLLGYIALLPGILLIAAESIILGGILSTVGYIVMLVLLFIAGIQRLHDLNRSGWFILLMFVPLVNIALGLYMLLWPGVDGSNDFGRRPPPNKVWNWICGLLFPVIFVGGIIAAIAIPAYQSYVNSANVNEIYNEPLQ